MGKFLLCFLVVFPLVAALCSFVLGRLSRKYRNRFVQLCAAVELCAALPLLGNLGATLTLPRLCGLGLSFAVDGFRVVMVLVTATLWLMTALPSREYFTHTEHRNRYYLFFLLTLGALMGVFLSADLFTTFVFFEMMSFTSYVWVVQNETPAAIRAADSYLAIAVIGGLTLLMGLFLLQHLLGTLSIAALRDLAAALPAEKKGLLYAAGGCCLVGFGAKAGMFPLHIWLPKAHPVAPAPASALLSGILTKSGIFGVLIISRNLFYHDLPWSKLLLALGVITMVLGAVLALFSIDLKRTLACSSLSQIGFILLGVAMQGLLGHENALAAWGTVLHMVNHSLIKLLLFVCAGIIYLGCHSLDLNEVRGFANDRPWLAVALLCGACSIAGVPGFSGYISKTLLHESLVEYIHLLEGAGVSALVYQGIEWLFLLSGGLTVAYMTKLLVALCIEPKKPGHHVPPDPYMHPQTAWAITIPAGALLLLGLTPEGVFASIAHLSEGFLHAGAHAGSVHYFAWVNLKGAVISLALGLGIYFLLVRTCLCSRDKVGQPVYPERWPKGWDLEERVYRPLLHALAFWGAALARVLATLGDGVIRLCHDALYFRTPGVVKPKENEEFGVYGNDPERNVVTETFAFELLMAGLGILVTLLYLLAKNEILYKA